MRGDGPRGARSAALRKLQTLCSPLERACATPAAAAGARAGIAQARSLT